LVNDQFAYLANHEQITNKIARALNGFTSENSMKEVFCRLHAANLIERVPNKKGASGCMAEKERLRSIPNPA